MEQRIIHTEHLRGLSLVFLEDSDCPAMEMENYVTIEYLDNFNNVNDNPNSIKCHH